MLYGNVAQDVAPWGEETGNVLTNPLPAYGGSLPFYNPPTQRVGASYLSGGVSAAAPPPAYSAGASYSAPHPALSFTTSTPAAWTAPTPMPMPQAPAAPPAIAPSPAPALSGVQPQAPLSASGLGGGGMSPVNYANPSMAMNYQAPTQSPGFMNLLSQPGSPGQGQAPIVTGPDGRPLSGGAVPGAAGLAGMSGNVPPTSAVSPLSQPDALFASNMPGKVTIPQTAPPGARNAMSQPLVPPPPPTAPSPNQLAMASPSLAAAALAADPHMRGLGNDMQPIFDFIQNGFNMHASNSAQAKQDFKQLHDKFVGVMQKFSDGVQESSRAQLRNYVGDPKVPGSGLNHLADQYEMKAADFSNKYNDLVEGKYDGQIIDQERHAILRDNQLTIGDFNPGIRGIAEGNIIKDAERAASGVKAAAIARNKDAAKYNHDMAQSIREGYSKALGDWLTTAKYTLDSSEALWKDYERTTKERVDLLGDMDKQQLSDVKLYVDMALAKEGADRNALATEIAAQANVISASKLSSSNAQQTAKDAAAKEKQYIDELTKLHAELSPDQQDELTKLLLSKAKASAR